MRHRRYFLFDILPWLLSCCCGGGWFGSTYAFSPTAVFPVKKTPSSSCLFLSHHHHNWQSHLSTHHVDCFQGFDQIWNTNITNKPDLQLAFLFVGPVHATEFEALVQHASLQMHLSDHKIRLVSILGGGVVGNDRELDDRQQPSLSLLLGSLPEGGRVEIVELVSSSNDNNQENENNNLLAAFLDQEDDMNSCLVFADPWSPVEQMLTNSLLANRVVAGGISCPPSSNQASLAIDQHCLAPGSVIAVGLGGTVGLQTVVAQGCRPIGSSRAYPVTACDGNVILELDGQPALEVLQNLANTAAPHEQEHIGSQLLCGVGHCCYSGSAEPDFLSRPIMGFVPAVQGIAVGTTRALQPNDLFCFQVRDGTTAQQDWNILVQRARAARLLDNVASSGSKNPKTQPLAAIQISCVARGRGMFGGVPNVDLQHVQQLGPVVGGFFANGEIGPVGLAGFSTRESNNNNNIPAYLHSFTTVAAILCEYTPPSAGGDDSVVASEGVQNGSSVDAWG